MIRDNERINRDIEKAYHDKKYIVTGKKVYQPHYSVNAGYYATRVYHGKENLTRAGRFFHLSSDAVNNMLGFNLLHSGGF